MQISGRRSRVGLLLLLAGACRQPEPGAMGTPTPAHLASLMDPATCAGCHPDHVQDWRGSMHAYAADDPVFRAMNQRGQRETKGALGSFCVGCHAPQAVRTGATTDGLNLDAVPQALHGVTCYSCHAVSAVQDTHNNALLQADDGLMRGPIADPVASAVHKSAYAPHFDRLRASSSAACGSCHDIVNGHGVDIERTFAEWQGSVFAQGDSGLTCAGCHMPEAATPRPIARVTGAPARAYHAHDFPAVDVALDDSLPDQANARQQVQSALNNTLQTALCVLPFGDQAGIRVIVDNVGAGHAWPSGAASDRRLWSEVVAYRGDQVLYQSGVVPDGTAVDPKTDADLWLLRECLFDAAKAPVSMFWDALSYSSQVLPAPVTTDPKDPRFYQGHLLQTFPRHPNALLSRMPDRITLRLRLQPVGLDVLDDLIASGDLDPGVRARMPTFDLGTEDTLTWTPAAVNATYYENGRQVQCVTHTNLNVQANAVRAASQAACVAPN